MLLLRRYAATPCMLMPPLLPHVYFIDAADADAFDAAFFRFVMPSFRCYA